MLSELVRIAAERARDAAEAFFKVGNIDMAVRSLQAAKEFNPELPRVDDYMAAYKVHELAAKNSTWYELLAITERDADCDVIKKQYKRMALILHPDKNHSVAAEGAFKLIQSAIDVLANPNKRKAYDDSQFPSNKRPSKSTPRPSSNPAPKPPSPSGNGAHQPPPPSSNATKRQTGSGSDWSGTPHHPGCNCSRAGTDSASTSSSGFRNNSSRPRAVKIVHIRFVGSKVEVNGKTIFDTSAGALHQ